MKIRLGFVSNSSSTSFCIFGTIIASEEILENVNQELLKQSELEVHYGDPNSDNITYLGRSWDKIKDDETGKQFKDSITSNLKKLLNTEKIDVATYEECYYNG